jgi:iron complex outermembrane receptor protein
MRSYLRNSLLGGSALLGLVATQALAQSTGADAGLQIADAGTIRVAAATTKSAAGAPQGEIETVIVTAEKRAEDSQHVGISLTAISGQALDKQGITGVQELQETVPSLRFGINPAGGQDVLAIRGFTSQNATGGGDSPVSYSVDGVYLARTTDVDSEFFDIDHIEVLRGPQGTLSGRNSTGGAVNVLTNRPTDELGGHVDFLIGDYDARTIRAWANVPLVDNGDNDQILLRITGVSASHDGYQTNVSTAPGATHNADGEDYQMLRGQLLFKLASNVDFLLEASENSEKAPPATKAQWNLLPDQSRFAGQTWYTDPRVVNKDYPENYINSNQLYSGTLNWRLGWATLTSVTGYAREHWFQSNDGDSSGLNLVYNPYWDETASQFTEEVRLASNDDTSPFKWIGGVFFFDEHLSENFDIIDTGLNAPFGTQSNFFSGGSITTTAFAPFGQIDYDLAKTSAGIPLTITAGLRWNYDNKSGSDFNDYCIPEFGVCFRTPAAGLESFNHTFEGFSGKFELAYKFSDDQMAYASYSRGFLSGGKLIGTTPIYKPETVDSYEIGFKSEFFDHRLQFNIDGFDEQIQNLQVFVANSTGSHIDNAVGHDYGGELEFTAIPVDGLKINGSVSLQSAKYDRYMSIDTHFGSGPLVNFAGHYLNQTPTATFSLGAEYDIETSFGTIIPRIDFFHSSRVYFLPDNWASASQGPYTQTNLHLTWIDPSSRYQIDAFVNNLENKAIISNDAIEDSTEGLGQGPDDYTYLPPRTIGLRFGVNF